MNQFVWNMNYPDAEKIRRNDHLERECDRAQSAPG